MKLMKIFGMVFALHVALACVLVLIQGCRSTPAPRAPENDAAIAPVETDTPNWSSQAAARTPPSTTDSALGTSAPVTGEPLSDLSPAERERAAPTRPSNPGAYISTSTPAAIAPPPPEPVNYVVRSGDSLWKIAKTHNTTTAALQKLNPTVKASSLRPGMMIKVPGNASPSTTTSSFSAGPASAGPAAASMSTTYIVRAGDSLSKIAARNGTTVAALREANSLRSDVIQLGQELQIPSRAAETGSTSFSVGDAPLPPPETNAGGGSKVTVVMQRGDTLGAIARKYDVTVSDLMAENNISDPTKVRVGQKLVIPGFHAVGTGAVPSRSSSPASTPARTTAPAAAPSTSVPADNSPPPLPPVVEQPLDTEVPAEEEAPPVQPIEGDPMPAP